MHQNQFPIPIPLLNPLFLNPLFASFNADLNGDFEFRPRVSFLTSILFLYSRDSSASSDDSMDFSKVGERFLSSVRSARSLSLLTPSASDRPEVPARAAAAAAVARALAGIPPHQRFSLPSSSEELSSIYGTQPRGDIVEEIEEDFYEEEFDPVKHIIEHIPSEENELEYFEKQATLRLVQLDKISERLSHHVMEHHEVMVKGMHLVREVEKDLKVANVICMNGRRHITSSRNEVSRDLIVTSKSKKKQALLDVLPFLTELRHALGMQVALESHVEEGNYHKAFQVLSEYLQLLDSFSELPAVQEMSRGVEVWLGKTLQKLDSLLLGVCQAFKEEEYITVVDAYALIGDISGLAEKIQSFFMQEVLSETHSALKLILQEDQEGDTLSSRMTYSDLWLQIPESKFRKCLLKTLGILFKLMSSYYAIMNFQPENKVMACDTFNMKENQNNRSSSSGADEQSDSSGKHSFNSPADNDTPTNSADKIPEISSADASEKSGSTYNSLLEPVDEGRHYASAASSNGSPWYQLRKDATSYVSQTLQRGRRNFWQLTTSRATVLLSSSTISASSIHQFLRMYEDLGVFILAGEAFCGVEAVEFRQKLKIACETYISSFHRQNIFALKMVMEKESWSRMPPDTMQAISFAGLVGDGAPLIVSSDLKSFNARVLQANNSAGSFENASQKDGFSQWLKNGNPFLLKLVSTSKDCSDPPTLNGRISEKSSPRYGDVDNMSGAKSVSEDENEDLLADFIDEDSQLPSRISKFIFPRNHSSNWNDGEVTAQTGSSLCLLRLMDKYARLIQKLEIINVEFFKGICQLFEIFFLYVYETFCQQNTNPGGKGGTDSVNYRLRTALSRVAQDCDQWIKPQFSSSSPISLNATFSHMDVTPMSPPSTHLGFSSSTSFGLKERCAGADTISLVAQILHRSKAHLQSMLLQNNATIVEDFYVHLVDCVPDLTEHIHKTTARLLLHIDGYADRIANAKWEPKELGLEHNGYVDLLLGEFKHYKTRLAHGGIQKEVQDLLSDYGLENVAETLVEGLSRVKRCTDEGRALMLLDLQVLINGLQHFVSINVKPKLQTVETFIKAYYLPETEYVHWARAHPEYSKSQIVGLINLVATMKGWKRKTRLEILEKIE